MRVLITGANRGLGLRITEACLQEGHLVFAGVRKVEPDALGELEQLQTKYGELLVIVPLDVGSEASVASAVDLVGKEFGALDVIVNNAGVLEEMNTPLEELDLELCRRSLDINVLGPIRVVKHFLPLVKKGENQSIINISSDAASLTNAYAGNYPYGISKAALNMFSAKLDKDLKNLGIRVLSVHPGWLKTDMGGEKAPLDPMVGAKGIVELMNLEGEKEHAVYVDYTGKRMEY
ncbi:MAG: SDR family oxidoreductase [Bacillus sp. (in: Bacteria)]|nr:SDR family oxidoreductase [Bacillus sp. (in: firmicutes)]